MRDAAAISGRVRFLLRESLRRPRMWHARTVDQAVSWFGQLQLLAWIDERDEAVARERGRVVKEGRSLPDEVDGIALALHKVLPDEEEVVWEAASTWAEIAWRLGFLDLDRGLAPHELDALLERVHDLWLHRDHTSVDLIAAFGEPSFVVGGFGGDDEPIPAVLCYASHDRSRPWVCFDLPEGGVPRLRSVRMSGAKLDGDGLRLTAYGKARGRRGQVFDSELPELPEGWEQQLRRGRLHLVTDEDREPSE